MTISTWKPEDEVNKSTRVTSVIQNRGNANSEQREQQNDYH